MTFAYLKDCSMFDTSMRFAFGTALLTTTTLTAPQAFAADNDPVDEIIVTGSPLIRSTDEAITGISVLSGDELAERLASTIGETLKSEPGVSSTAFGAGASRPIIRGQGGDRVRVLTNGIGSIDASSASPDHAVAVEPAQAERIEVLRGAALLRYGSSGAGGVVNVIDGRIPSALPDDGVDGALRIGGSTVDNGFDAAGSVDLSLGGGFVAHIDGSYKDAGDYDIPGFAESDALLAEEAAEDPDFDLADEDSSTLENSAVEAQSYTGGLSYVGSRGFIGFAVHNFQTDYGVPGGHGHEEGEEDHDHDEDEDHDEESEEEEEVVTIGLDQTRIDVNGRLEMDGAFEAIQVFGGYADYEHTEFEGDEIGTVFTNEGYEIRTEAITREVKGYQAAYGVQLRDRDFAAIGDEAFVPPTNTRQIGLYTFQQKDMGDLHLEGALRYENTRQESPDASGSGNDVRRTFDLFSASAGGDIHLSDAVRLGGTLYRTERAPTTEELYSNGPHLATEQFEVGNPDLNKEVATGIEAALRYRAEGSYLTANIFYTDYKDYIFEARTDDEEDGLPVYVFTGDDAKFYGGELQVGADLASLNAQTLGNVDISVDGLVEYVRAKTDSGNLPRIPPLSLLAGIEAEADHLSLRAEVDYTTEQNKVEDGESATDGYALTNAFLTWHPDTAIDARISLSVHNIFDVEARQHTSFLKEVAPLPGRNFRVSLRTAF